MRPSRTRELDGDPGRMGARPARRATLHDIAEILGVSEATVSRALRDDPQIGRRTREAVSLVAAELEYVPNHAARSLAKSASMTLGLMVPDVVDQLHGLVVKGFQDVALARDRVARPPCRVPRDALCRLAAFRAHGRLLPDRTDAHGESSRVAIG